MSWMGPGAQGPGLEGNCETGPTREELWGWTVAVGGAVGRGPGMERFYGSGSHDRGGRCGTRS